MAETTATPQAFMLQTMFKDARAAPEGFNGYKGFADGSTTKACIRLVPPEAYSDGKINWDHPGIVYVDLDADLELQHVKAAVRLNGGHNGFSHRLLLGTDLVGVADWLGLAKESAGVDADVKSGQICASVFDVKKDASDTVVLATIPQSALADSTWTPAAQAAWAALMAQKNDHVAALERDLAAAATLQKEQEEAATERRRRALLAMVEERDRQAADLLRQREEKAASAMALSGDDDEPPPNSGSGSLSGSLSGSSGAGSSGSGSSGSGASGSSSTSASSTHRVGAAPGVRSAFDARRTSCQSRHCSSWWSRSSRQLSSRRVQRRKS